MPWTSTMTCLKSEKSDSLRLTPKFPKLRCHEQRCMKKRESIEQTRMLQDLPIAGTMWIPRYFASMSFRLFLYHMAECMYLTFLINLCRGNWSSMLSKCAQFSDIFLTRFYRIVSLYMWYTIGVLDEINIKPELPAKLWKVLLTEKQKEHFPLFGQLTESHWSNTI